MKRILFLLFALHFSLFTISAFTGPIVWDLEHMRELSKDPAVADAVAGILRDADKQLMAPCPSVMDKQSVAPGGDKHDYFSMARYWWPNPDTENGLPYVRHDGRVNPETKNMDRENLSSFEKMLRIYALAYFYSGREEYADKGWDVLRTWFINKKTRMNPNMEYSQVRMGHMDNHGSNSGLLDGYSFLIVPDALQILSNSKCAKKKDIDAIRSWFTTYLNWMLSCSQGIKENNSKNNHGTAYHIQVAVYAAFVGNDSVAALYRSSFPERRIFPQVASDGSQPEELVRTRAFGYSCYNLVHYMDMLDICRLAGHDLLADHHVRSSILAAIDYLVPYLGKPVSAWPFQQIADWEKEQQKLCWIIYRADKYFPDNGYKDLFKQYSTAKPKDRNFLIY